MVANGPLAHNYETAALPLSYVGFQLQIIPLSPSESPDLATMLPPNSTDSTRFGLEKMV